MMSFLIMGPKHSGKTTAGRALALKTGAVFIDLDQEIEKMSGKSPRALYREGAALFREAETRALAAVFARSLDGADPVIAAGGGLCDNEAALALVGKQRRAAELAVVALDISADAAWERIRREAGQGGELPAFLAGAENPREAHRRLHERRSAACREMAGIVINIDGMTGDEAASAILERHKSMTAASP